MHFLLLLGLLLLMVVMPARLGLFFHVVAEVVPKRVILLPGMTMGQRLLLVVVVVVVVVALLLLFPMMAAGLVGNQVLMTRQMRRHLFHAGAATGLNVVHVEGGSLMHK